MELFFLAVLFVLMIYALGSGYPVAFALPGSAIVTILLAGFFGLIVATINPKKPAKRMVTIAEPGSAKATG